MRVRRVQLVGFGVHTHLDQEFPACGLTLVHGRNGAGKSTIIEAISACLWGTPLRGVKMPTTEGTQITVELHDGTQVSRRYGKTRDRVELVVSGVHHKPVTASKAAPVVEGAVGTWESWRRTHVLSVHDAQHFSLAGDRERKRLLEDMLGLSRFDTAFKTASLELREARVRQRAAHDRFVQAQARHTYAVRMQDELAVACPPPTLPPPSTYMVELLELTTTYNRRFTEVQQCAENLRLYQNATHPERCPTCGRDWGNDHDAELTAKRDAVALQHAQAQAGMQTAQHELLCVQLAEQQARTQHDLWNSMSGSRERAVVELEQAYTELEDAATGNATANDQVRVAEAVAHTFSPTGPRVQLLQNALLRLSQAATRWVAEIASTWVVQLVFGEQGRALDAIQLRVGTPDNLRSYQACSTGERRRVDVGLCLALRELGHRAGASNAGTLWVDDLFDALDHEGRERLAALMRQEAQRVNVVVLAPTDELAPLLRPQQRIEIT